MADNSSQVVHRKLLLHELKLAIKERDIRKSLMDFRKELKVKMDSLVSIHRGAFPGRVRKFANYLVRVHGIAAYRVIQKKVEDAWLLLGGNKGQVVADVVVEILSFTPASQDIIRKEIFNSMMKYLGSKELVWISIQASNRDFPSHFNAGRIHVLDYYVGQMNELCPENSSEPYPVYAIAYYALWDLVNLLQDPGNHKMWLTPQVIMVDGYSIPRGDFYTP